MKKNYLVLGFILFFGLNACQKKEAENAPEGLAEEGKYVRILVADAEKGSITMLTPRENRQTSFTIANAKAAVYASTTGRYAFLVQREQDLVQIFDSGIEEHDDHAHQYNSKLFSSNFKFAKPTHFAAHADWSVIFNDGDGSTALFSESELERRGEAYQPRVLALDKLAHHGAIAPLDNNLFAVTEKVAGTAGTLPQKVKVIDQNGNTVRNSNIQVTNIHGEAPNGKMVAFGSTDGVILASASEISLLPYPTNSGLNNQSGNWLGTILGHGKLNHFFGFARNIGLFRIDANAKQITSVLESKDILSVKLEKNHLLVLMRSGDLRLYNAQTSTLVSEQKGVFRLGDTAAGSINPTVAASEKYIYLCVPEESKIKVFDSKMMPVHTFNVQGKPSNISFLGSSTAK